ncbi:S8 family serine peptidase [Mumia zhuanghuii]|uniref:S8 family serine peptidase n=2 Tax=Mumia TaxID=1546255 RepID=A0ABW1QQD2_9ACTN|nr:MULTISPECIES: S8 family serine peptidase [Mumia]KAA1423886.1 S8 family serine peptidase [Mumia zhuanghuii]
MGTSRTLLAAASTVALAAGTLVWLGQGGAVAAPEGDPVRVVVGVEQRSDVAGVAEDTDADVVRTMSRLPVAVLEVPADELEQLAAHPDVVSLMEDVPERPSLASSLPVINGDDVHGLGFDGTGATVAVLDTGIDADHPFYGTGGARIVSQFCSSTPAASDEDSLCPDGTTTDTNATVDGVAACLNATNANICDHGSHVAGIAAGSAATDSTNAPGDGVAPGAQLIAMQVFTRFNDTADCDPDGVGDPTPCVLTYPSDQINALNQLIALDAANPGWNVVAANMSLGGGNNGTACDGDTRKTAIDGLLTAGVATVISAGNDSHLNATGAPGCISTAFTVGSTTDADAVSGFSNRGGLLDVFAPGSSIISSEPDDTYGSKSGTSMAAPHVTGALAVLRAAYPARTVGDLMNDLRTTGVPITYATNAAGTTTATTPRIDLLAALRAPNEPPTVTADAATVTAPEGSTATNSGTFADPDSTVTSLSASRGAVVMGAGTWTWSEQTSDGPDSDPVTITATDDKGETGSVTFTRDVTNVVPTVTVDPAQVTATDEGGTISVEATFADPGWPDTHTATVDFGTGTGGPRPATVTVDDPGGPGAPRTGTITADFPYGDNGSYTVTVAVTDDDGGVGTANFPVVVTNLGPSVAIDDGDAVTFPGGAYVVTEIGETATVEADGSDPGSDDLTFTWDDGSGPISITSFNDGVGPEPDEPPTPTPLGTFPFFASDDVDVNETVPGVVELLLELADDDGATASDDLGVIVTGDATSTQGQGWWKHQYSGKGKPHVDPAFAAGYLEIVDAVSSVFSEDTSALTPSEAHAVLQPTGGDRRDRARADLLLAWLELASGAVSWDATVPLGGGQGSVGFLPLMFDAEETILDPAATNAELQDVSKDLSRVRHAG